MSPEKSMKIINSVGVDRDLEYEPPYTILWGERVLRSVANLTRRDGEDFLALAPKVPIHTKVTPYPLERVNDALEDLRHGRFTGAAVLLIESNAD